MIVDFEISQRILVIAEIGINHEGDFETAKEMVEAAAGAGVDAVKFQTFRAEKFIAKTEKQSVAFFKKMELTDEEFIKLAKLSKERGLIFLSTPFDPESADLIDSLSPAFKIASGDLTCLPLIEYIAAKDKPILLSTGGGTVEEIEGALKAIKAVNRRLIEEKQVVLLHCVSSYPTPIEETNLKSIPFLKERFGLPAGFSDHTLGITACLAAAALGARVIEKHFTLNKYNREFRDHQLSADAEDMISIVKEVRMIEQAMGEYKKEPQKCELNNIIPSRRSLAARIDICQGEVLTNESLTFLRPGSGISPAKIDKVVGRRAVRGIEEGTILSERDVSW